MTDTLSREQRSAAMSKIRSRDTAPELLVRRALWSAGLRFRLQARALPGRPDIVLRRWNAVVFVHGCFWHRHEGCPLFRLPATRPEFWEPKLLANQRRDTRAIRELSEAGWRVLVVWECALKWDAEISGVQAVSWVRRQNDSAELLRSGSSIMMRSLPSES
ncbi:very short patch repair endonuclease [Rhodanobacter sp. 115]|uniref:very short patch repair endonuclease n=1 Tax=Rhodanobacter sp. FW021-MT20 TaxID=1162282 RepID=UPI000261043C|nr:very short patch repair endonuclease [Rhodanobacter sp. 115]EIL96750.1 DNA mismatch endonuclease Vsr [Rhodanobacter sp. 115]